ncbi:hypothetical protein [Sphingomonas sp. BAUL-RG-20F-R05-02]|uniref:hypothetical protein n=1 Tax=Sphingomonas sp. BAUL-RG-20F-R05-02 TaxID=2914830 RepID=UPI001F58DBD0|nr:hypothetical protein [Sphingomonas sp. BAUL-RG-20F-R05-02]
MQLPGSEGLEAQVDGLRKSGSRVFVIEPDEVSRKAIGHNLLSPEARVPAAEAGRVQGRAEAVSTIAFSTDGAAVSYTKRFLSK